MDWRKIEQALIEIAKLDSIEIEDTYGNPSVEVTDIEGDPIAYSLTDLAKELAERLK